MMPKSVAIDILSKATRAKLVDSPSGDTAFFWTNTFGNVVAYGYLGRSSVEISMCHTEQYESTIF